MGSIGFSEILVILVVALLVLGPTRLPEAARQMGRALSEFRRVSSDLQAEMRDAFSEPPPSYGNVIPPGPLQSQEAAGEPPAGAAAPVLPERSQDTTAGATGDGGAAGAPSS